MKPVSYAVKFLLLAILITQNTTSFAQEIIRGTVKDSQGLALPGATVAIRGTRISTSADSSGSFKLEVKQQPPFFISASFIGFKQQDFQILKFDNSPLELILVESALLEEIVVTSRRRSEAVQDVPIPISVVGGAQIEQSGAFNTNRIKELIPSVQFYSSNPRNTTLNIRGLGSTFGLTNDGIDPGVGFYVDGVYYARPAAGTLDFIDVERIEVLRGPQGTIFGKNTSSGAFNITTRKPSFVPNASFETSFGNFGFIQAKASVTGPLSRSLAGRLSISGTQRNGLIENIRTLKNINDINNLGFRAQLLYQPSNLLSITLAADNSSQRPDGYAQVVAGVAPTLRPAYRQFNAIIADLNYQLPSLNAFDRKVDHDSPWNSGNDLGGVSLNADIKIGPGTLTSTTAWRYWKWDPSNDRDFTGLQSLAKSNNYSKHDNWSQEIRYAGDFASTLSGVVGLFYIDQEVQTDPVGIEESGTATWRFSQSTTNTALWRTPGLFEGYGVRNKFSIKSQSAAVFANLDWEITGGLHVLPGIRFNYDKKDVDYNRTTYGGLQTTDPALLALKALVYTNQAYIAVADENNFTYQLTVAYRPNKRINSFATYSTSFKPMGVNVSGLPTVNGAAATNLAVIKPEDTRHFELGLKTNPSDFSTLNITLHNSDIRDYQTNVQSPEIGVNRGYLANAEKVNVKGIELDGNIRTGKYFSFYGAATYTDAKYVRFTNAPLPLEETGLTVGGVQVAFKDISGGKLPGVSKWAGSLGGEFSKPVKFFNKESNFFTALDAAYRSDFSSSPSPSKYLNVDAYTLLNGRIGYKSISGLSAYVWGRNVLNKDYFEQLLPAGGNAGHYAAVLGDPRTFGLTLRYAL